MAESFDFPFNAERRRDQVGLPLNPRPLEEAQNYQLHSPHFTSTNDCSVIDFGGENAFFKLDLNGRVIENVGPCQPQFKLHSANTSQRQTAAPVLYGYTQSSNIASQDCGQWGNGSTAPIPINDPRAFPQSGLGHTWDVEQDDTHSQWQQQLYHSAGFADHVPSPASSVTSSNVSIPYTMPFEATFGFHNIGVTPHPPLSLETIADTYQHQLIPSTTSGEAMHRFQAHPPMQLPSSASGNDLMTREGPPDHPPTQTAHIQRLLDLSATPPPPSNPSRDPKVEYTAKEPYDLYRPRWVRGDKNSREGWCGLCGRWLLLKTSAFNYDKINAHGISPNTRWEFDGPVRTRSGSGDGNGNRGQARRSGGASSHDYQHARHAEDVSHRGEGGRPFREGLCGQCGCWEKLSSKPGGREGVTKYGTKWLKHAHKVRYVLGPVSGVVNSRASLYI
ncbi:MAG: hypothetical protein M1831_000100 [Alyxoria varia]|nr:MAG: hypothetical protein M1831_000100 [Alyxoria varia]